MKDIISHNQLRQVKLLAHLGLAVHKIKEDKQLEYALKLRTYIQCFYIKYIEMKYNCCIIEHVKSCHLLINALLNRDSMRKMLVWVSFSNKFRV